MGPAREAQASHRVASSASDLGVPIAPTCEHRGMRTGADASVLGCKHGGNAGRAGACLDLAVDRRKRPAMGLRTAALKSGGYTASSRCNSRWSGRSSRGSRSKVRR